MLEYFLMKILKYLKVFVKMFDVLILFDSNIK